MTISAINMLTKDKMSGPAEQIDNPKFIKRGKYETYMKRITAKFRRRKVKEYLRDIDKPEPNDKQYSGWTT